MEKRRYPRSSLRNSGLKAKVILSGGSLIKQSTPQTIEIAASPVDISQGGICLTLKLDVPWETLTPRKEVFLFMTLGSQGWHLPATVVHHKKDHRTIGLKFSKPIPSLSPFFTPPELS